MSSENQIIARKEIKETLKLCNLSCRKIGLSVIDDIPKTFFSKLRTVLLWIATSGILVLLVLCEGAFVVGQMSNAESIEEFAGSYLHIAGYGALSYGKFLTLWYKRHSFRHLVRELEEIWPVSINDVEDDIKNNSLSALKVRQYLYVFFNILGVLFYDLTPIAVPLYEKLHGDPASAGYVWQASYPFDKTKPVPHTFVYIFEVFGGLASVCCMLGTDLLFMTMASHISMLLRLLQKQIRHLGSLENSEQKTVVSSKDVRTDIAKLVKIHQRLIRYINDLEDAFSLINLINVLLSSVNICFVAFSVVIIDSWMEVSNKMYLGAVLTQMGVICWYADDISQASAGVADAVYESSWYNCNTRSRRALLIMLQRSQKPLYFTALKFSPITLITYSSILKSAYSYFTLLYTSYSRNKQEQS